MVGLSVCLDILPVRSILVTIIREEKNVKNQISESIGLGILLAISGGLMDAYSYLFRDEVFANAQTGNILLFGVNVARGAWGEALSYFFPVLAFSIGIASAVVIRQVCGERGHLHWRQYCLAGECVILFGAAVLPQSSNLLANSLISLACGAQVEAFRKIQGSSVATTMCIGNLRSAIHSGVTYGFTGARSERHSAKVSGTIILFFVAGAVAGSLLLGWLGKYTLWVSAGILALCTGLMFISPGAEGNHS